MEKITLKLKNIKMSRIKAKIESISINYDSIRVALVGMNYLYDFQLKEVDFFPKDINGNSLDGILSVGTTIEFDRDFNEKTRELHNVKIILNSRENKIILTHNKTYTPLEVVDNFSQYLSNENTAILTKHLIDEKIAKSIISFTEQNGILFINKGTGKFISITSIK